MLRTTFKTVILVVLLCTLVNNSHAQKQTMGLKSATELIDSSYAAICSYQKYLPINSPRGVFLNLISQTKDKKMIFADFGFYNTGISVYYGNKWEYWNRDNYLNSNNILGIYNDSKGNMWISTDMGLNMYNGSTWKSYTSKTYQEYNLSNICEDKNGNIWSFGGSYVNLGYVLDTINHIIKPVSTPFEDIVTSVALDKNKDMWVASRNGVFKYDGNTWKKYSTKDGLNHNNVTYIKSINDTIYCLSGTFGDSIKKFDGSSFKTAPCPVLNNNVGFKSIIEDSEHNIWILCQNGSVYKKSNGSWIQVPFWNVEMYNLNSIFADKDGNIWGTSAGIKVSKISNGNIELINNDLNKGIGFSDPTNLFIDKNNKLWVKPNWSNGLSNFDGNNWNFFNNLPQQYTTSFAQDKDGTTYVGGTDILKFDGNNWNSLWGSALGNYHYTSALMFDKNNNFWFYSDNKIIKSNGTNITEYTQQDGILPNPKKILQDKDGNIWVVYGNDKKVLKFDGSIWSNITIPVNNGGCTDASADSLGNIWLATTYGLVKYNKSTGMKLINILNSKIPFDRIIGVCTDNQNNIWFVSDYPKTLGFYNQTNNTFRQFPLDNYNFYPYGNGGGIAVDSSKNVYLGSSGSGLLKLSFSILMPEIIKTDVACVGADNGTIKILPKKDLAYTFSINGSPFTNDTTYSNLKGGNYTINCKKGQCYAGPKALTITQPIGKFDVAKKNVTCYGLTNGSISILTEGLGTVSYTWPTGKDTSALLNIGKGTYKVTVKYGTCQFDRIFDISEPKRIILAGNHLNACGNKGKIDISLTNGVEPYSIKWSNGDTTLSLKNLEAGNYKVSVKDANNCNTKDTTFIVQSFNPIPKSSIIGISKAYICSNNLSISTIANFTTYAWYKGNSVLNSSTKSILATETGVYKVAVVDQNNCLAFDSIKVIKRNTYATPQICLVTVDNETNKNKIIWNKFTADSSAIINVLKETNQSGKYSTIGNIPAYTSGIFIDNSSSPTTLASRYKLNITDECKIDSDTGTIHKTIHLTSNMGTHGEVNLIWSGYEGFTFNSYNIYRGTTNENLTLLTTIQSNLNSYTDVNPPTSNKLYYQLEVIAPSECNPNALKVGITSSKSNIIDRNLTTVGTINPTDGLKVFPNPIQDIINVTFNNVNGGPFKVKLCDITGKTLRIETTTKNSLTIDRGNLKSGIYLIELEGKVSTNRLKIILK